MPFDLTRFGPDDATTCRAAVGVALGGHRSMEGVASALCCVLYDELATDDGQRACVMVRCYVTQPYGALPRDLQRFAKRALGAVAISPPEPAMRCLTLLATVGDEPEWNDRRQSAGHQAIPLPSPYIVERAPMIAQLVRELGLDLAHVARPAAEVVHDLGGRAHGVFHVPEAKGSPYIPAQAGFVDRYGVRSVLGFGGALGSGELFATILFARVPISADAADGFADFALDVKRRLDAHERSVFEQPVS